MKSIEGNFNEKTFSNEHFPLHFLQQLAFELTQLVAIVRIFFAIHFYDSRSLKIPIANNTSVHEHCKLIPNIHCVHVNMTGDCRIYGLVKKNPEP